MQLDAHLRALIETHLAGFDAIAQPHQPERAAAVALCITDEGMGAQIDGLARPAQWSHEAALILTRRAADLRNHAGQWALPGGRIDAGETPVQAALRELREEIGLDVPHTNVLGVLDDYATRSGFTITPVVVWAGPVPELSPNAHEVASVHRIPLAEFMRPDSPLLDASDDPGRHILRVPVGRSWIAAPTAALLYQFREVCIAGRRTHVAHFDQPMFARR